MKEVRVGNDKVSITKMTVRVVSGLQLSITPDSSIENGYIAETSVTRKLTAQYQASRRYNPLTASYSKQNTVPRIFVEFSSMDSWNCLGETKNDVYHRRLTHFIDLSRRKWNKKFSPSLPTFLPRTLSSFRSV